MYSNQVLIFQTLLLFLRNKAFSFVLEIHHGTVPRDHPRGFKPLYKRCLAPDSTSSRSLLRAFGFGGQPYGWPCRLQVGHLVRLQGLAGQPIGLAVVKHQFSVGSAIGLAWKTGVRSLQSPLARFASGCLSGWPSQRSTAFRLLACGISMQASPFYKSSDILFQNSQLFPQKSYR